MPASILKGMEPGPKRERPLLAKGTYLTSGGTVIIANGPLSLSRIIQLIFPCRLKPASCIMIRRQVTGQ
ncbi:MAG: hypothetical protein R6U52_11255 [Kosmotogaceae bacterium]